jgi:uncharacterized protein with PQ loop repeat
MSPVLSFMENKPKTKDGIPTEPLSCIVKPWVRYVGITAGVVTSLAFSQQAYQLIMAKKGTDLTWITLSACVLGQLLWIMYGYGAKDKIISTVAVVSVSVYLILVATKVVWR